MYPNNPFLQGNRRQTYYGLHFESPKKLKLDYSVPRAHSNNMNYLYNMNYITFKRVLESTFKKPELMKISIGIQPINFFNQSKSISEIHRTITNSKQIMSGKSNRDFWKQHFLGGLYTFNISNEAIFIVYYLVPNNKLNNGTLNNLKARIKKVLWSEIEITHITNNSHLSDELEKQNPKGVRFIGEGHKIKTIVSTSI
jgi:hypothetical protein